VRVLQVAKIRAGLGILFALLGAGIGIEILFRPEPVNQKLMGLAFAVVLIALGTVRVRMYLKIKSELDP
jgi:hypothetical protein